MSDLILNYVSMNVICAGGLILLAHASLCNVLFISKMKKYFAITALITMIVIIAEASSIIFESIRILHRAPALIANTIGFSLSPFIAIVLSKAFSVRKGKTNIILTIPVWINFVLVISSPWTGLIFKVNSDNSYLRGPLFFVYMLAYLCSYSILIVESLRAMKYYQKTIKSIFIMLLIFTVLGTTIQLIWPHIHVSWLCVTLSLIMFYAYFCVLTQTQDTLTGLLNRSVYDRYTKDLNTSSKGTVIIFDVDNFKRINDLYGHQWGDFCLQMIGSLIRDCFYKKGCCYRIGGDEFCVICHTTDELHVEDLVGQFHHKIDCARKNSNLQGELPMVSTGYAVFYGSYEEYRLAAEKADTQMYSFKNKRK